MDLKFEDLDDVVVITVGEQKLDATNSRLFKECAIKELREGVSTYLLDLSEVRFIDSSGIGAIVGIYKQMQSGERLEVCDMCPVVERVFKLLGLGRLLTFHETRADALDGRATSEDQAGQASGASDEAAFGVSTD